MNGTSSQARVGRLSVSPQILWSAQAQQILTRVGISVGDLDAGVLAKQGRLRAHQYARCPESIKICNLKPQSFLRENAAQ